MAAEGLGQLTKDETILDHVELSPLPWTPHLPDPQPAVVKGRRTGTQGGRISQEANVGRDDQFKNSKYGFHKSHKEIKCNMCISLSIIEYLFYGRSILTSTHVPYTC